jgi:2-dehydropantoate 2-reductase
VRVKIWDVEAALEQIRPLVGPETTVVSFQNGVLKDAFLRAAYGEERGSAASGMSRRTSLGPA